MRLSLILSVLALTAVVFYSAIRSFSTDNSAEFDQRSATLNQTIADQKAENLDQTAALEAAVAEQGQLKSQLEETNRLLDVVEAEKATLEADKDGVATAQIEANRAEFDQQTAALNQTIVDLKAGNLDQTAVLDATAAERDQLQSQLEETIRQMEVVEAQKTALEADKDNLATAQGEANRAVFDQQTAALNQTIADQKAENLDQIVALEAAVAKQDQLQSQLEETNQLLGVVKAEKTTLETDKDSLAQELAKLTTSLESRENASLEAEASVEALNDAIEEGRNEVQTLQVKLTEVENKNVELSQQLTDLENNAVATSATSDDQIAQSQALLEQNAQDLAAAQERVALLTEVTTTQAETEQNLTDEIEGLAGQLASLTDEAATLSDEVAKRDAVVAGLLAKTDVANTPPRAGCQDRTDAVIADAQVSFEDGTATLDANSVPLLEELAVIASDCVQENLTLEIEGHTGNSGGIASNLLLSDGRAKAVRDFLVGSGVPAAAVRAVGYGGSEPIADNETGEGQLRNRRIVFDWEES